MSQLAEVCHESVRVYSKYTGLVVPDSWDNLSDTEREKAICTCKKAFFGGSPSQLHRLYEDSNFSDLNLELQVKYSLIVDIVRCITITM